MSDFKPGQIAKATVRGVPDVTVFRVESGAYPWASAQRVRGDYVFGDGDVTDVRPLVVLDIEDPATFVDWLRNGDTIKSHVVDAIADQIEAQTRPAIEEPKGKYAEVEMKDGRVWFRDPVGHWRRTDAPDSYLCRSFDSLKAKAVRVLSEGVQ